MKKNRILTAALAGALSLSLAVPALGASWTESTDSSTLTDPTSNVSEGEKAKFGHTTVSIVTANTRNSTNVSFEVPLYLTLGVLNGTNATTNSKLITPTEGAYYIKNTSGNSTYLKVDTIKIEKLQNSTYKIVDPGTVHSGQGNGPATQRAGYIPNRNDELTLEIGWVWMPGVTNAGEVKEISTRQAAETASGNAQGNAFYMQNGTPKLIAPVGTNVSGTNNYAGTMNIFLDGRVKNAIDRPVSESVPQFKVSYVITPTNANGDPLTSITAFGYAGDSSIQAGLGTDYTTDPDTNPQVIAP